MGIVELHRHRLAEFVETVPVVLLEAPHHVLEGGGDEKVLLFEPQFLAGEVVIRRVEDLRDGLGADLGLDGADIIALAEKAEVEFTRGPRRPQPHVDHMIVAVARHQDIAGHGHDVGGVDPLGPVAAVVVEITGDIAIEADREDRHPPLELPRRAVAQPVVRGLDLVAVDQLLIEQPVFIADTVPVGRDLEGGDRIHETGGEPAETAVAEPRLLFLVPDLAHVEAEILDGLLRILHDPEVDQAVAERTADQELEREIVDPFLFLGVEGLLGRNPLLDHDIAHRIGQCLVDVGRPRPLRVAPLKTHQMVDDVVLDRLGIGLEERLGTGR